MIHVVRDRGPLLGVDLVAVVVEGGGDGQATGIQQILTAEDVVGRRTHRVHEVRCLVALALAGGDDDLLGLGRVALGGGDIALLHHLVEHEALDAHSIGIARHHQDRPTLAVLLGHRCLARVKLRRRPHQPGQHRRLRDRQLVLGIGLGDVLAEVGVCCGPDPVGVVAVVDLVDVHLEQLLLALLTRVPLTEAQGKDRLLELAFDLPMRVCQEVRAEETNADQLLADGRRSGDLATGRNVLQEGPHDAAEVDARVGPEGLVLGGNLGVDHDLGDLGEGDHPALLGSEGGELDAIRGHDAGALAELEILHLAHVGQAARVAGVCRQDAHEQHRAQHGERAEHDGGQSGELGLGGGASRPCAGRASTVRSTAIARPRGSAHRGGRVARNVPVYSSAHARVGVRGSQLAGPDRPLNGPSGAAVPARRRAGHLLLRL